MIVYVSRGKDFGCIKTFNDLPKNRGLYADGRGGGRFELKMNKPLSCSKEYHLTKIKPGSPFIYLFIYIFYQKSSSGSGTIWRHPE